MAQSFVHEEIVINAPLSAVWALMGRFEDMSPWFPSAAECSADRVGVGAVRRLVMPDGGELLEEQTARVEGERYDYRIIGGKVPFTNYCSTFAVQEEDGRTRVIWSADFDPVAGAEQSAAEFVARVYRGGLENARMLLEQLVGEQQQQRRPNGR